MSTRIDPTRVIRAPRGTALGCTSWLTEAAYRMPQNNLDAEVAENLTELVVYGGITRAARDWQSYDAILSWPLLNAMLNIAAGATWVSLHHDGGVGMGYSQHAGVVIVCDGSVEADKRMRACCGTTRRPA